MNNGTEEQSNNINDNDALGISFNDIDGRFKKPGFNDELSIEAIDRIADMLEGKLGVSEPSSRPYYCTVARLLPAATLERLADTAKEVGKHPGRLFTYLTKKEIAKYRPNQYSQKQAADNE
jgi:hypothetical protein